MRLDQVGPPAGPGAILAETVEETLILRGEADPAGLLRELASRFPVEPGRTAVLTAPSVTGRPDLFDLLPDLLTDHLGGAATGIRLVPLGRFHASAEPAEGVRQLADWVGQEVTYPYDELVATAGGTGPWEPASGTVRWALCPPGGRARADLPWSPAAPESPAVDLRPPVVPPRPPSAGAGTMPVGRPPLVWRPPPSPGRRSGTAPPPAAEPVAGVPVAGVPVAAPVVGQPGVPTPAGWSFLDEPVLGGGPVLAGFLIELQLGVTGVRVGGRPATPRSLARLIDAVWTDGGQPLVIVTHGAAVSGPAADVLFGGLADALARPVRAADAEVTRTATGLLRTVGTFRRWQPRAADRGGPRVVTVLGDVLPRRPAVGRPGHSGPPADGPPAAVLPVPVVPRPVASARVTPAPVVEPAELGSTTGVLLAVERWLVAAGVPRIEPPSLPDPTLPDPDPDPAAMPAPAGPATKTAPAAEPLPVAVPDRPPPGSVSPPAGSLPPPVAVSVPSPVRAGSAAPVASVGASVGGSGDHAGAAAVEDPGPAAPLHATAPATRPAVALSAVVPPAVAPSAPARPVPTPRWLTAAEVERAVPDRVVLRQALAGRYDAHARVVSRTLAESPGLRAAAGAFTDLTAGLVALRAYRDGERALVNQVLRGGGAAADLDRAGVVARCAAYGLRRLPSVLGPVFRAGPADPRLVAGYRPGEVLVEPAFVDVRLVSGAPGPSGPSGLEFAIWSVSAHRLDGLDAADPAAAVFAPGSRFLVLAVDDPVAPGDPVRVLLRDLAASYRGGRDSADRILAQLRAAVPGEVSRTGGDATGPRAVPMDFAPGLDDAGRPFPTPAQPAGAGSAVAEGGRA